MTQDRTQEQRHICRAAKPVTPADPHIHQHSHVLTSYHRCGKPIPVDAVAHIGEHTCRHCGMPFTITAIDTCVACGANAADEAMRGDGDGSLTCVDASMCEQRAHRRGSLAQDRALTDLTSSMSHTVTDVQGGRGADVDPQAGGSPDSRPDFSLTSGNVDLIGSNKTGVPGTVTVGNDAGVTWVDGDGPTGNGDLDLSNAVSRLNGPSDEDTVRIEGWRDIAEAASGPEWNAATTPLHMLRKRDRWDPARALSLVRRAQQLTRTASTAVDLATQGDTLAKLHATLGDAESALVPHATLDKDLGSELFSGGPTVALPTITAPRVDQADVAELGRMLAQAFEQALSSIRTAVARMALNAPGRRHCEVCGIAGKNDGDVILRFSRGGPIWTCVDTVACAYRLESLATGEQS